MLKENYHQVVNGWVRNGGVLLYYGNDMDPFQKVTEWWNTGDKKNLAAFRHLFELFGLSSLTSGKFQPYGNEYVSIIKQDPKEIVLTEGANTAFLTRIGEAYSRYASAGKPELVLKKQGIRNQKHYSWNVEERFPQLRKEYYI